MFSLIISIISIALVAALAAATVYFGGAAFNKGSAGADASTFVNSGQQIAGAFTLASADGYDVSTVAQLQSGSATTGSNVYLSQIPTYKGKTLVLGATDDSATTGVDETEYLTVNVDSSQVCEEINKRANGVDSEGKVVDVTAINGLYGCVTTGTNAFYKVK